MLYFAGLVFIVLVVAIDLMTRHRWKQTEKPEDEEDWDNFTKM